MSTKISSIDNLIHRECVNILAKVLGNKKIGFEKTRVRAQREVFWLNGGNVSKASAGNRVYRVVPFLVLNNGLTYWLAVSIQVNIIKGNYQFHDASLFIFEGTALNEVKTPILRAEWGLSENGLHAQPHWHIYPSYINEVITPFIDLGKSEAVDFLPEHAVENKNESSNDEEIQLPKFHFAMASLWHAKGRGAHVIEFNEKSLANWLGGCLEYIKNQLGYMME